MRQSSLSLSLGRIFGIEVRIHVTWLFAFALVTWGLASGYFRFVGPRQGFATPLLLGAVSALLLFASVLVHEFSHSLVARARGLRVHEITLFIFGGIANLGGEARTARDELYISLVGPLTSFVLAGVFWLLAASLGSTPGFGLVFGSPRGFATLSPPAAVLSYLAVTNALLGAFNLLPAFPLDGGRVFRSIMWGITQRYDRATAIATNVGQAFGYLLAGLGLLRLLSGDLVGGMWTIFIGWFLGQTAAGTQRERRLRQSLRGVRVAQVMDPAPTLVQADSSLQALVFEHLLRFGQRRLVVVNQQGLPFGLIDTSAVTSVPRDLWPVTSVQQVMRPLPSPVSPDMDIEEALGHLDQTARLVPVVADDRLLGVVDLVQVLDYARLRQELEIPLTATRPATT